MPPVGFEPAISAGERPQNHALDRSVTGTAWWRGWYGITVVCSKQLFAMDKDLKLVVTYLKAWNLHLLKDVSCLSRRPLTAECCVQSQANPCGICGKQSYTGMGTGSFLGVKSGRGVTLTPHPLLVPWSRKGRGIPLLPLWVVRSVQSLSACTRVHFTLLT